jgi:hydroxymethylpyrimidine/phosphomethylpyrimidine kinase
LEIEAVSAEMVCAQIEVLLKNFPVAAIKTGLLFSADIVAAVAQTLRSHRATATIPLVIDPVMVATSGDPLLRDDAVEAYERELFPLAALITPNLGEATRLLGEPIGDLQAMRNAGARLREKYRVPVLLKGGHLSGADAIDLLFLAGQVVEFSEPFSRGINTHGTGCTYSAAITAGLTRGLSLEEAVRRAKKFVTATIAQHLSWETASGASLHALNHSPTLPG